MQTSTFPRKLLITATITSDFYEANDKFPHFPLSTLTMLKGPKKEKKKQKKKLNWAKGILAYQYEDWLEFFQVNIWLNITSVNLYYLDFVNPDFSIIKTCLSSPIFNEY